MTPFDTESFSRPVPIEEAGSNQGAENSNQIGCFTENGIPQNRQGKKVFLRFQNWLEMKENALIHPVKQV